MLADCQIMRDQVRACKIDGLGKAHQAIDHGDEDVGDAAALQFVHNPQAEFGALGLLDSDAENLLHAVRQYAKRDVDRLVADEARVDPELQVINLLETREF